MRTSKQFIHGRATLRVWKAVLAVLVTLSLALSAAPAAQFAAADTASDLQNQLTQLQKQRDALQAQINTNNTQISNLQAQVTNYQQQIDITKQYIDTLSQQIGGFNTQIDTLQTQMDAKQTEIDQKTADNAVNFARLQQRLVVIAKSGDMSSLQMMLSENDLTDYLYNSKIIEVISASDQQLIDQVNAAIEQINTEKASLAADQDSLNAQKAAVASMLQDSQSKAHDLDVIYQSLQAAKQKLQQQNQQITTDQNKLNQQMQQVEDELYELSIGSSAFDGHFIPRPAPNPMMFWPVPAVLNISSPFGPRWGTIHYGIDIANGKVPAYGQNIVAAANGIVTYVNKTDSWGGGYGYYVMIDHGLDSQGRKIVTLYAHQSKVLCSVGQVVVGGLTVIGLVGDTGDVTGPHLHFEVRVNGTRIDPIGQGYVNFK